MKKVGLAGENPCCYKMAVFQIHTLVSAQKCVADAKFQSGAVSCNQSKVVQRIVRFELVVCSHCEEEQNW